MLSFDEVEEDYWDCAEMLKGKDGSPNAFDDFKIQSWIVGNLSVEVKDVLQNPVSYYEKKSQVMPTWNFKLSKFPIYTKEWHTEGF